jgi:hypothetical protein
MPTYRLQTVVSTVYEIYVDADDDAQAEQIANNRRHRLCSYVVDPAGDNIGDTAYYYTDATDDFPQFVWDGTEPDE